MITLHLTFQTTAFIVNKQTEESQTLVMSYPASSFWFHFLGLHPIAFKATSPPNSY